MESVRFDGVDKDATVLEDKMRLFSVPRAEAYRVIDAILRVIEDLDPHGTLNVDDRDGVVEIDDGAVDYLVSWHEASRQIWISSPKSGSVRFEYDANKGLWYNKKGEQELLSFVKQEVSEIFGISEQ